MKKLTGILCLLLALTLLPVSAPAEGELTHAAKALYSLLFDTDNVTLSLNADLSWEGEWFKTFSGTHRQQGTSSRMEVSLTTPRAGRQPYTGGYTVTSADGIVRSVETYYPSKYRTGTGPLRASVLSDTALRRTVGWLFTALLTQTEKQLPPYLVTETEDGGTTLHIVLKPGETPDVLNAALTLAAEAAAKKFLGADFDLRAPEGDRDEYTGDGGTAFRNWDASFAKLYLAEYGEELPAEFLNGEWPDEDPDAPDSFYARYEHIAGEKMNALLNATEAAHPGEYVLIEEDNTATVCPDYGTFVAEGNMGTVWFLNERLTFLNWYSARDPEHPLTQELMNAIEGSDNMELSAAYWQLRNEMYDEYHAMLSSGMQGLLVLPGGGTAETFDLPGYLCCNGAAGWAGTVTEYLQLTARKLEVSSTDVTVELDREGRLAGVSGSLCLTETDLGGWAHPLEAVFDARAEAYGATEAEPLDVSGLVTEEEYYANYSYYAEKERPQKSLPDTVVLNGVSYPLSAEQ